MQDLNDCLAERLENMQFTKIDDKTIRCFVSMEELESFELHIEDLFEKSEKQQRFFGSIVKQARDLMGFVPPEDNIVVNVQPVEDQGIVVTLSEESQPAFLDHFAEATKAAERLLRQQMEILKKEDSKEKPDPVKKRIYCFGSFRELEAYTDSFSITRNIKSSLSMDEASGKYYLTLEKGRMGLDVYNAICNQANDFATMIPPTPVWESYQREHFRMLIPKYALNVVSNIAQGISDEKPDLVKNSRKSHKKSKSGKRLKDAPMD